MAGPAVGVAWTPVPATGGFVTPIHQQIQDQVTQVLGEIPPGKETIAAVTIRTGRGVNLAFAHKIDDHWKVAAWVGKSGWNAPVEGGAAVTFIK